MLPAGRRRLALLADGEEPGRHAADLVLTASLDPIRDQGRAYAAALVQAGVKTVFREADGNIHGFINLRKAIPSADEEVRGAVAALKLLIEEAAAA
jgi:acetyl esterase